MPHYDFEDEKTGERVELFFMMSEAPAWGEVIEHEGRKLKRIVTPVEHASVDREVYFKCWRVSGDEAKGARHYDPADGCPVFTSKQEVRDFLRVQGGTYGDGRTKIEP